MSEVRDMLRRGVYEPSILPDLESAWRAGRRRLWIARITCIAVVFALGVAGVLGTSKLKGIPGPIVPPEDKVSITPTTPEERTSITPATSVDVSEGQPTNTPHPSGSPAPDPAPTPVPTPSAVSASALPERPCTSAADCIAPESSSQHPSTSPSPRGWSR